MSIIGVTVGTPTSPRRMEKEIKPVKTVNGQTPDESGNVKVDIEFATDEEVEAVLKEKYGETSEDVPEVDIPIPDIDFATKDEVEDMLDDIFGEQN